VIVNTLSTRSALIGGPIVNWRQPGTVITNYIKFPKSVQIDRPDLIVIADYISKNAAIIKFFSTNSGTAGGGKSITNSLIGSENFYVDGSTTGTNLTSQTAYWI
jgi:hypothetical protein